MARPLKVVHVGLGPIGQGIARLVAETDGLQIVGATDPFPDHAGKDLGALLGLPRRLRVKVEGNPAHPASLGATRFLMHSEQLKLPAETFSDL